MTDSLAIPRVIIPELDAPPPLHPEARRLSFGGEAFATTWRVRLCADPARFRDSDALATRCRARLARIDAEMSPYRSDSDLTRFNTAAAGTPVALPAMLRAVIAGALDIAALTNGAFDPTVLQAVELWGFGARAVPPGLPADEVLSALPRQGWQQITLGPQGLVRPERVHLDLCGIAKGYAVDAVLDIVRAEPGVTAALVEIGGELKGFGVQPDGQPWWIGIDGEHATHIALCDWAVATSGDGRRAFTHEGRLYSHIIDATSQSPTRSDIASATVFDRTCWRADALATALIVMGERRALAFAEAQNLACLLRVRDGDRMRTVLSPRLTAWADDAL
jgi:thiamine biosynthesis lipoprotein